MIGNGEVMVLLLLVDGSTVMKSVKEWDRVDRRPCCVLDDIFGREGFVV